MKRFVVATFQHEATHNWPHAKDEAPEVAFLSNEHRHVFHVKLIKEVSHGDRDIEFIILKRRAQEYLQATYGREFGRRSCEDVAEELLEYFKCSEVQVFEDGENGAVVSKLYDKESN